MTEFLHELPAAQSHSWQNSGSLELHESRGWCNCLLLEMLSWHVLVILVILVYAVSIRAFSCQFQDPLPSSPPGMCSRQCHTAMCSSWGHQISTDPAMLRSSAWLENFNIDIKSLNILLIDFPNNKGEPCNLWDLWVPARHFAQVWAKIESNLKQFESYYYILYIIISAEDLQKDLMLLGILVAAWYLLYPVRRGPDCLILTCNKPQLCIASRCIEIACRAELPWVK